MPLSVIKIRSMNNLLGKHVRHFALLVMAPKSSTYKNLSLHSVGCFTVSIFSVMRFFKGCRAQLDHLLTDR